VKIGIEDIKNKSKEGSEMSNDDIRIKTGGRSMRSMESIGGSEWGCPYCHGTGQDPYCLPAGGDCPACHGHRYWESSIKYSDLQRCDRCDGIGKVNLRGNWAVCPHCLGSGRI